MTHKLMVFVEDKITESGGYTLAEIDAIILKDKIGNRTHFVHLSCAPGKKWSVTEYQTGGMAGSGYTIAGAIESAKNNINKLGVDGYAAMLAQIINKHGVANTGKEPEVSDMNNKEMEDELQALALVDDEEYSDD